MKINITLLFFIVVLFSACKEFIEPSLEGKKFSLLAPADKLETNIYRQTFWWEGDEDALAYRLQVVTPRFDSAASLLLDTLIYTDKFIYTLEPGQYEWRVRAENGSSHTAYFKHALSIYPSSLSIQTLQVLNPVSTYISSDNIVKYEWLKLYGATRYRLQADTNGFADSSKLVLNTTTTGLTFTQNLKKEGRYEFRVRGENDTQLSKWSAIRNFIYDATPPGQVVLTSPSNKSTAENPVKLQWQALTDAEKYEVSVYKSDSLTAFQGYPVQVTGNGANFNSGSSNDRILWRVRAIDKAGNKGPFSNYFSFIIK